MENIVIDKQNVGPFVNNLIDMQPEVIGPKRKDGKYAFGKLTKADELRLDYDTTLLPPKMYLLPPKETLITFELGEELEVEPAIEAKPIILFGVHPYDIKAIELLDTAFSTTSADINYLSRREKTTIIGIDCLNPSPNSFCASMGTATTETGFDLMLTDIGNSYVVAIGSSKGNELLRKYAEMREATQQELAQRDIERQKALARYKVTLNMSPEEVPHLLDKSWDSLLWKERGQKCLSCGSCVMVCPTCFCFDVQEDVALNLKVGERYRQWDACMLTNFALVAGGGNFRKDKEARFRHRMYRKGKYAWERWSKLGCVGCGRCASACLAEIASPAETFNLLKEESK
jgi:ferredoxin